MRKLSLLFLSSLLCILSVAQTGFGTTSPNAPSKLDVYATANAILWNSFTNVHIQ